MSNIYSQNFILSDFISEYAATKLFDMALKSLSIAVKRINKSKDEIKLQKFEKEHCLEFINQHLSDNINWATNVSFRDATKSKKLTDIFIELDLFLTPVKLKYDKKEKISTIPISELFTNSKKNIILLGQPGAGKTTSSKKIFLELLFKEKDIYQDFSFPLVIKLKNLSFNTDEGYDLIIFKEILNTLGIFYSFEGNLEKSAKEKILIHIFKDFIEKLDVLIILDGYDEISNKEMKNEVIRNLNMFTHSLKNSKFILTSRSADYDVHIENSSEYEICPLSETQITNFISRWLNDENKSLLLLSQLRNSPYWDTTIRPLTLAHLCALYERNNSIPEKPKSVYKKIIELLLEDWSNQNLVIRKSKYARFEVDRKMDFLSRFAYELTIEYGQISFSRNTLELLYRVICLDFGLPRGDYKEVVKEIESHNGLIIQTGSDNYEFTHKSILEYLVSDYLVKLPILINDSDILKQLPNELAIMIAISSNPNVSYFNLIVELMKDKAVTSSFLLPFLSRLIIEKPDFIPNSLFSITNIYLLNEISKRIYNINDELKKLGKISHKVEMLNDKDENYISNLSQMEESIYYDHIDLKELKKYYSRCADTLISFKEDPIFKSSLKELSNQYQIGQIELSKNNTQIFLKKWGKTYHLKRMKKIYSNQSIQIELPDNLILVKPFKL